MRPLELLTREPLLKLTALVLAFLLWALVETGGRTGAVPVAPDGRVVADSAQSRLEPGTETRSIPVAVRLAGKPLTGWEMAGPPQVEPAFLTVTGPASALERIDTVRLPTIRLDGRTAWESLDVEVDTAGLGFRVVPVRVRVTLPIRPVPSETTGGGAVGRPEPALAPAGAEP